MALVVVALVAVAVLAASTVGGASAVGVGVGVGGVGRLGFGGGGSERRRGGGGGGGNCRRLLLLRRSACPTLPRGGGGGKSETGQHPPLVNPDEDAGPMEIVLRTFRDARRHLLAAAAARATSIFGMYPVDTIKTRVQAGTENPFRLKGMYGGVGGSLLGQVPYGVLTFGSYEMYKSALLKRLPNSPPAFVYALSAVLGDLTGSGWLCPSEVVKSQTQAGLYPDATSAVRGIWTKRGVGGFYQGYVGGLARDVPFRVAQLTSYEVCKGLYLKAKSGRARRRRASAAGGGGDDDVKGSPKKKEAEVASELSSADAAIVGAVAGSFSAAITTPLDRIRTLLMTDASGTYGTNVASCAAKIWSDEGWGGFFTGVVPRVTYIAPSVAIFFIAYEAVQQRLAPPPSPPTATLDAA